MKRLTCLALLLLSLCAGARTIPVGSFAALEAANKSVQPGDTVLLLNGAWSNVIIRLTASGTEARPIVYKAQTPGSFRIGGASQLRIGGNYLVIDGWSFTNGHTPGSAVIDFRVSDKQLANHCRVTNCVVDDYNQPKRMNEDYWVSFSGKHNRVDHCTFRNKKNLGVLIAVVLDDDRSRANFHEIDHNYFAKRPPLASNAGEIIRVGVSQHCQFNSNTQIHDNYFEECDGETEVVSIKSCSNVVRNNLFRECQGDVVLRHGNDNTVVNNIFFGNGKEGTGGVRVINRGQWVANNLFYRCRGVAFRSPLSLMNGIPNSPANRYVQVTDAVIANNSFYDCTPISFGEGSDAERTLPPVNVVFANNIFYNRGDSTFYHLFDNIDSIRFSGNALNRQLPQPSMPGFGYASFDVRKSGPVSVPVASSNVRSSWIDSLKRIAGDRPVAFSERPGFSDAGLVRSVTANAATCGAAWFPRTPAPAAALRTVDCPDAASLYVALSKTQNLRVRLTGSQYTFDQPVFIPGNVTLLAKDLRDIRISTSRPLDALFVLQRSGNLVMDNLRLLTDGVKAGSFIASDTTGSSEHFNLALRNITIMGLDNCNALFTARAATIADSIVVFNCKFYGLRNGFLLEDEKENKGYYNVEKMRIERTSFAGAKGTLLSLYRGGNDESTMGPDLYFVNNEVRNSGAAGKPLFDLMGVQKTMIGYNRFISAGADGTLIRYRDNVRAVHVLTHNMLSYSGKVEEDKFVTSDNNRTSK